MIAKVEYKEVGNNHIGTTSYTGENITRDFIIDFFGLNNPDIEWYNIQID